MAYGVWNLNDLFKTNDDFLRSLGKASELLGELVKFKGKLSSGDEKTILKYFHLDSEFSMLLECLAVYGFCKLDDNGKDKTNTKNNALIDDFCSSASEKLAFAKVELSAVPTERLLEVKEKKEFKDYARTLEDIIRDKSHTLTEDEEQKVAQMSSFSNAAETFTMLSNVEMDHGTVENKKGEKIKLFPGNYNSLMNSSDPAFRRQVMETYFESYNKLTNTFANLFTSHLKYENFIAKIYKFNSVLEMKCFYEEVSPKIMMVNIESVSKRADLLREYFMLKKKCLKLDVFRTSDIGIELGNSEEKIEYKDAISDIRESYKVFGEDYQKMFDEAVNNGWIDAFPRENKKSGGYTTSVYASHPYILLNFDGTIEWASAITHEFGHAMHSIYSAKNQPYPDADYTLFVAEIVSLTNEILYNKYLLSKAKTKEEKIKLLSYFLQLFSLNVFDSSRLAEFELYVHNSLQDGESLTAEDYNKKYVELAKKYFGDTVELTKFYEVGWSRNGHMYRDYYLYKYSMGLCAACFVAEKLLSADGQNYLKKYKEFLSLGSSKDPISSLKVADIDVLDKKLYDSAFETFEWYLNELKKITED